ncbi:hypothetical protein FVEG_15150 [Fusarium verticillioides 7600]|uniref:Uncharacterized protein n=1 Tax=Gibberella moniliformis (strain M3125 / FGSC 7600) TaxID=334819 RepID=W7M6P8_GIBM7|nr:hypothetical protein FVEG_15150 [Fusarium verticillioides 7600]EWG40577.1 hypothetical protein FVEG_15150 [Fusarium verticillioides 7600]
MANSINLHVANINRHAIFKAKWCQFSEAGLLNVLIKCIVAIVNWMTDVWLQFDDSFLDDSLENARLFEGADDCLSIHGGLTIDAWLQFGDDFLHACLENVRLLKGAEGCLFV